MQKNHVETILPDLAKYSTNATIVILGNNGTGWDEYKDVVDPLKEYEKSLQNGFAEFIEEVTPAEIITVDAWSPQKV